MSERILASVELKTPDVPMNSVKVWRCGPAGFHVQLGSVLLWVRSQQHWADIALQISECFDSLPAARSLPRKGGDAA